jgi:hypothetical protein
MKLGTVPPAARGSVLEHAPASSGREGADLSSGILVLSLGDASVAEQHGT